jgi:hypothetical protein
MKMLTDTHCKTASEALGCWRWGGAPGRRERAASGAGEMKGAGQAGPGAGGVGNGPLGNGSRGAGERPGVPARARELPRVRLLAWL